MRLRGREKTVNSALRVVIVDDEDLARGLVRELVAGIAGVEVVGECANGFDAVRETARLAPDLLLLDVQMPGLSGLEVAELLAGGPAIVFVTAYEEHAVRAFDLHAVDYVLKPVQADRLARALARARERARRSGPAPGVQAALRPPGHLAERVLVREGEKVHVIPVGDVDFAEGQDDAVRLRARGRDFRKPQRLADLEEALDPRRFVRIHRSFLLNLERLARIELYAKDSRVAVLADGTRLPISRSGYERLRAFL